MVVAGAARGIDRAIAEAFAQREGKVCASLTGIQAFIDRIVVRRMGTTEDIAHALMFLAYASWITGKVLPVTGGPVA